MSQLILAANERWWKRNALGNRGAGARRRRRPLTAPRGGMKVRTLRIAEIQRVRQELDGISARRIGRAALQITDAASAQLGALGKLLLGEASGFTVLAQERGKARLTRGAHSLPRYSVCGAIVHGCQLGIHSQRINDSTALFSLTIAIYRATLLKLFKKLFTMCGFSGE